MKRPNITPGKWTSNADTVWMSKGFQAVCSPYHHPQSVENARAIASVPALLAALDELLATHELRGVKGETFTPLQIRAADAAKAALTAAGYTFD